MKGRIWYWLGVGPLLIGGVFTWLWTEGTSEGTVRTGAVAETQVVVEPVWYTYQGKYVSFETSEIFQEVTHTLPETGPVRETIFLVNTKSSNNEKIAVSIEERENN
jgi:hypothetical protein